MSEFEMLDDERFDRELRELGPEVPCPEMDDQTHERLMGVVLGQERRHRVRRGWGLGAGLGLIAALLVLSTAFGVLLIGERKRADRLAWERSEVIELLKRARQGQRMVAPPEDLSGVEPGDVVLVTFDHELCPIAAFTTPAFQQLAQQRENGAFRFVTLDVTGAGRDEVETRLDEMELTYAAQAPLGTETGVVRVLDTRRGRVLCSGLGRRGLAMAQSLMTRVSAETGSP